MRPEKLYLTDIVDAADAIGRFVADIRYDDFVRDELRQSAAPQKLVVIGEAARIGIDDLDLETLWRNSLSSVCGCARNGLKARDEQ